MLKKWYLVPGSIWQIFNISILIIQDSKKKPFVFLRKLNTSECVKVRHSFLWMCLAWKLYRGKSHRLAHSNNFCCNDLHFPPSIELFPVKDKSCAHFFPNISVPRLGKGANLGNTWQIPFLACNESQIFCPEPIDYWSGYLYSLVSRLLLRVPINLDLRPIIYELVWTNNFFVTPPPRHAIMSPL